ncbi:hypothetical protein D9M71_583380 [compost metagenome]
MTWNGTFSIRMYWPSGLIPLKNFSRTLSPITATAAPEASSAWVKKLPWDTGQLKMSGNNTLAPPT